VAIVHHNKIKLSIFLLNFNLSTTSIKDVATFRIPFIICIVLLLAFTDSHAQPSFSGLLRNYNGITVANGNDLIVGRNLARANFRVPTDQYSFYVSGEVLQSYTQRPDSLKFRLREAYVDLYMKRSELRVGKQVISRGRANGSILSDILSPLDLSEFLTQEFSDLRQGTIAVTFMTDVGPHQLDLVLNPVVSESLLPKPGSTWDFQPDIEVPIGIRTLGYDRRVTLKDMQYSAQFRYRPNTRFNLDVSAQYWEYPLPTYGKVFLLEGGTPIAELQEMRLRSPMIGLSGDFLVSNGILATFEGTFYTRRLVDKPLPDLSSLPSLELFSTLDPLQAALLVGSLNDLDRYTSEKPFTQLMGGLDLSSGSRFASLQTILEYIPGHDATIAQNKLNTTVSVLVRDAWYDERLRVQTFVRYGVGGKDYWINPELTWKPVDQTAISVGAQVFGGAKSDDVFNFRLSRYADNSFIFTKLTWSW